MQPHCSRLRTVLLQRPDNQQSDVKEIGDIELPKFDFIEYFFTNVRDHADINKALISLVQITQIKQNILFMVIFM